MKIRLYMDEDAMAAKVIPGLRSRGVDVLTATQAGMLERDDEDQLVFAAAQSQFYIHLTRGTSCNSKTEWVSAGQTHAGIILGPQKRFPAGEQIRRLSRLIEALSAEQMRNRVECLSGC